MVNVRELQKAADVLRRDVILMTSKAGSGHLTSCLSCAEIMSALFFNEMKYDIKNPFQINNDEFILSKGHAAPILYACLNRSGCIKDDLSDLRKSKSRLEGHPMPSLEWVKVATGSLGQGLSVGIGMALAGKLQKRKFRVFVLVGDSEMSEGSNYEAMQLASHYKLDNICLIIDANRLGQRGETMAANNVKIYEQRFKSFGWSSEIIDGHNISEILSSLSNTKSSGKPSAIIAKTLKGKGVSFIEDKDGWHGRVLTKKEMDLALSEIPEVKFPKITIKKPEKGKAKRIEFNKIHSNSYEIGAEVATRFAYGKALAQLAKARKDVIAIDAEVSNSTYSEEVKKQAQEQFIEAYIAEQNMISMALGLSKKGFNVFASTFAAFLTRAHDQIRMASLSNGDFTICGSHAGVSVGEDGPSQMGLEDIALFRSIPNSSIFYPSDALSTEKLVALAAITKGIKYIRTTRPGTPVIYKHNDEFPLGDFKIVRETQKDKVVLIGSGITVFEALKARVMLKQYTIESAVLDLYCIKPFDAKKFIEFVEKHGKKVVIAEDHYPEGGIGEMLTNLVSNTGIIVEKLAIKEIPHSGKKDELLANYNINAEAIMKAAKKLVKG